MNSIRSRLIIYFAVIIALTVAIAEIMVIGVVKQNYYSNLQAILKQQLILSTEIYDKYFSDATLYENIQNNVDSFWNQVDAQVQIYDMSGQLLLDSIGVAYENETLPLDAAEALRGNIGVWRGKVTYDRHDVMSVSSPLVSRGEQVGVLRFVSSMRKVNEQINRLTRIIVYIGFVALFVGYFLSFIISFSIVYPIKSLTRAAQKMAQGNLDIKCKKRYNDEVGKLADTLNHMAFEIMKRENLKNEFISSVSHELRTPLTSIKGWAVTLRAIDFKNVEDKELLDDGLKIIESEADRLTEMVEQLLDFSKLLNGKIKINRERTNIYNFMKDIIKQHLPRANELKIHLKCHIENDMPCLLLDTNRLKQVFVNILDNSLRYTPEDGEIIIEASYIKDEKKIRFVVSDTGCGIDEEELPRVKEKFYKGRNSKSKSGIGLSICDEIIKLLEGTFDIKSTLGKGTIVTFEIPAHECWEGKEDADE